jgi:hypothetical protein
VTARSPRDESGAVIVMVAILLPILLGMAGLALDIGNWYLRSHRQQKAADAAALAGAVYLPMDATAAFAAARNLANSNGFADDSSTAVSITQDLKASRLRVSISQTQRNFFGAFLGLASQRITRTAVSEFQAPVTLGSPTNSFGDEPIGGLDTRHWSTVFSTDANQPLFWANIAGPQSKKANGDAHQAGRCDTEDNCAAGTNTDYSPNGYFYAVHVPSPTTGKLAIQVFDPAFVNVGDHCDARLIGATAATNPYVTDPATRYAMGNGKFCTGDQLFTGGTGDGVPPTTSFVVRAPSDTPWDPLSGAVVSTGTCKPTQYRGYDLELAVPLQAPVGDAALQQVFRRWVPLCTIDAPVAGDYLLQVRTNIRFGNAPTGPADPTTPGGGHNRFALRAAFLDAAGNPNGAGVHISATTTMAIYANAPSATTQFYLVRVPSGSGGRVLVLSFFDIADASGAGKLTIVAPVDSGATFSNCTGSGPQAGNLPTCVIDATGAFNGRWEHVRVPIPAGYTCNDGDPKGCWVRIQYAYGAGTTVQDTTTWAAAIEGDPVRLVE